MLDLGTLGETTKLEISATSVSFEGAAPNLRYVVSSNRAGHIRQSTDDSDATTADFYFAADTQFAVKCQAGSFLTFITATGETDGDLYIAQAPL